MNWSFDSYTILRLVWIAASKPFSNCLNDVNALGQSKIEGAFSYKEVFSKIEPDFNWMSWQDTSTTTENYKFSGIFGSFATGITLEISHQMISVIRIHKGNLIENFSSIVFIHSYSFSYSFGCAVIRSRTPRSFKLSLNWFKTAFCLVKTMCARTAGTINILLFA